MTTTWPTTPNGKWLVLRTVDADWRSRDGFRWRKTVPTIAPDWDPDPARGCGGGLHGLLWGCGEASYLSGASDAVWLVVEVDPADVADPDRVGKVRFRSGRVVYHGTRESAVGYLSDHGAAGLPVVYAHHTAGYYGTATAGYYGTATAGDRGTATAGDRGTATAGYYGTATAGNRGTATAGDRGTATAGYYGTATAGNRGTATAGNRGTATAGHYGTATAGNRGTATAGNRGTATAGYYGTATAGNRGTATAGDRGTATAGDRGTATAGDRGTATAGDRGTATAGHYGTATAGNGGTATAGNYGTLVIAWHDEWRKRIAVAYVGEAGIKADTPYRLDGGGNFVAVAS